MSNGEKKTAVVTGGAGFIGSFLCEQLLRDGYRVVCIDNFSTGHIRNIEGLLRNPDFQFLKIDITTPFDLDTFVELESFKVKFLGVQEVYHLAVPTVVNAFNEYRMQTLLTNAVGTRNVLDMAVKYKAKVVFASAAVVYGPHTDAQPSFAETDMGTLDHLNPRGCYNEGKRFAETMCATYADVHGIDVKIARIFRTYGPRMSLYHGHQIPDFVMNALDGKEIVVNGDANTKTALVYVADVVDALVRLMRADRGVGVVNVGSDVEVGMGDVATKIIALAESASQVRYAEPPPYLLALGLPNLHKAHEALGWMPLVRLEDGLQKTVEYIRANKMLLTES